MAWKPSLQPGVDLKALNLSPLESLVATRLDGRTDVARLAHLTGLSGPRVEELLGRLVSTGAVATGTAPAETGAQEQVISAELDVGDDAPLADDATEQVVSAELDVGGEGGDEAVLQDGAPDDEADEEPTLDPGTHRKLFETELHALELDVREARARDAVDPELTAYCFDPAPKVILSLLDNPRAGLAQARLVALHHRHPQGLEALAARAGFAADQGVRRNLLKNPQLPSGLFRRLWSGRRLLEQWKLVISREVPEQTRRTAREVLRQRFATGPADERVELIMKTEGRCLVALTGIPIDSKTTALLCGRSYGSTLFIQNLARWSAAPPPLIAHLLRQEIVRRNPVLRTLLRRHPNAPSGHG